MDDEAREIIAEHARHPRNAGGLAAPTHSAEIHNPLCGDRVRIDLLAPAGRIEDVGFVGRGCAISQAAASLLTEELRGMALADARAFGKAQMLDLIGIPLHFNPTRMRCALLAWSALHEAIQPTVSVGEDQPTKEQI
jgi:nitrogen fixation NifU-like protein